MSSSPGVHIPRDSDQQTLRKSIESPDTLAILNVYSVDGFGKSQFLQDLQLEYAGSMPLAFVHAKDYLHDNETYALDRLLQAIVDGLRKSLFDALAEGTTAAKRRPAAEVVQDLFNTIDSVQRGEQIVLIIIDDYDAIPPGVRAIFESNVLNILLRRGIRVRVILSSEQELAFPERLDLRLHLTPHPLGQPSEGDIARAIPPEYESLAPLILSWSGGFPAMVQFLVGRVREKQIDDPAAYRAHEEELLGTEYRQQLNRVVFDDTKPPPEDVFETIALVRRFDVAVLRYILPLMHREVFADKKQIHYLDLIHELGSRVTWLPQSGYVLDKTLRDLMTRYVSRFDVQLFKRINELAFKMYEEWLQEGYRQQYLLELLYHYAQLQQTQESDASVLERVTIRAIEYIGGRQASGPATVEQLEALRQALESDDDLQSYIDKRVYLAIAEAQE